MKRKSGLGAVSALSAAVLLAVGAAGNAWAKATPEELSKLGSSLTCTGGEKAGTASGVPEFTGKWLGVPEGVKYEPHTGQHPVDPYASEKPVFTITAENLSKYAERLTEGQKVRRRCLPDIPKPSVFLSIPDIEISVIRILSVLQPRRMQKAPH